MKLYSLTDIDISALGLSNWLLFKGVDNRGAEGAKAPPPPRFLTTIKNDCYRDCNTICEK